MPELPDRIGRYVVDRELGRGGMGVIFKAHDPEIDRPVAIKLIRADLLSDEGRADYIIRFRREAQAAGRCAHPNIVGVYDIGLDHGDPFMAMEYVEGLTLAQAIARGRRFSIAEAVEITQQLLAALACAHEHGVIHRDIKPANVLLQGSRVKVMDFGIARLDMSELTQVGAVVGSAHYMSPEQCQGEPIDHRSDLFSAGTMLYLLLTGKRPFDGNTLTQIAYKLVHEDPPDLRDYIATAPAGLAAVLRRALAKKPADRYPSAQAMSAALGQAVTHGTVDADATVRTPDDLSTVIAPDLLANIERAFATHVGPVAHTIVTSAARGAPSAEVLCNTLARSIVDPDRRRNFLDTFRTGMTPGEALSLPAETVAQIERETARYLGPIAKILVKRTMAKASSLADLRTALATHVEKEADRASFLAKLPR